MQETVDNPKYDTKGIHVIGDYYGIEDKGALDNEKLLRELLAKAIEMSDATLVEMFSHKFSPQGVTISAIISESSAEGHFYPEHGYMSISFYTCGDKADPIKGLRFLKDYFKPDHVNVMSIGRGTKESIDFKVIHVL